MKKLPKFIFVLCICSVICIISESAPLDDFSEEVDEYEEEGEEEEEERILFGNLLDDMFVDVTKNGVLAPTAVWPNATVRYKIAPAFEEDQVTAIKLAMSAIEAVSCVRFLEAGKKAVAFVHIVPAVRNACNSMVGYHGERQVLRLSQNVTKCFKPVVIMHELFHTLGFYHEHMSPNRDDYITVNFENIVPDMDRFFNKLDNETVTDFGYGYDYESIMHYGPRGFSSNGLETITPLYSDGEIGQRLGLSLKDIGKLNAMYNCTLEYERVQI